MPFEPGDRLLVGPGRVLHSAGLEGCPRRPRHDPRTLGVVGRTQRKGLLVVGMRLGHIEADGPVSGQDEKATGAFLEHGECSHLLAGRTGQGDGLAVVVGDDLDTIGKPLPGQVLQPLGGRPVPTHPPGPGDLGVSDVPDDRVPERVLGLAFDRGHLGRPDQLLALQFVKIGLQRLLVTAAYSC